MAFFVLSLLVAPFLFKGVSDGMDNIYDAVTFDYTEYYKNKIKDVNHNRKINILKNELSIINEQLIQSREEYKKDITNKDLQNKYYHYDKLYKECKAHIHNLKYNR